MENFKGDTKQRIVVASPPQTNQVRHFNPGNNLFTLKDQLKPLGSGEPARKDMIGPRLEIESTSGQADQPGRPYQGPSQAKARQARDSSSNTDSQWTQLPCEQGVLDETSNGKFKI